MNIFRKTNLMLGSALPSMSSMGLCFIDDAGAGEAAGGGSSGGEGQPAAESSKELTTAEKLEQEFGTSDSSEDDSGESSDGDEGAAEAAEGEEEDGDGAGAEADEEAAAKAAKEKQPEPKKSGRMQERFDELTNASREHEREAAKWKGEAMKLGYVEGADPAAAPEEPDPEKYTYGEHDPEYLKDRGKYDAKVEMLQGQAEARFKAEAASLDAKWTKNLAGAAETYPDFDEVVVKGAANWECPPIIAIAIKDSDVGPDIAYALAKDPAEATRIAKLSPLEQAREFGRKESSLTSSKRIAELEAEIATLKEPGEAPKPKTPVKVVSKAPEPPKRRVTGGGARSEPNPDTDDFREFERYAERNQSKK